MRLRIVNASAATFYWLTFGGEDPLLVSADGLDVVPVEHNKTLIGVAETYDYIVTIPQNGKLQIRATAQDGSGETSAYLGTGDIIKAPEIPVPDLIGSMKEMMAMGMKMGAPASKLKPSKNDSIEIMKKYKMEMGGMEMQSGQMDYSKMEMDDGKESDGMEMGYIIPEDKVVGDNMKTGGNPEFNYNYLRAPEKTVYDNDKPVREMLFNLTGNMNRYVWSINGVPLSETDKIKIKQGEVVRITLNNLTMMHHPMHLHGHFFRVFNENGDYSPLKHTVNVAPMQKVVIEFDAKEYGDWFFHCHVLYHMGSGMARIFSYAETPTDERLKPYPLKNLTHEANEIFTWGEITVASHMTELHATATNIRNQFTLKGEYGWNKNLETEFTYERYLNDYFRVFGGVNVENENEDSLDEIHTSAIAGVRYLLPMLINSEFRIDNYLRPQLSLSADLMIFPRLGIFGEYEYQMDFGWVNNFETGEDFREETTWQIGLEYVLSRNFILMGSYDSRFGFGGGASVLF